MNKRLNNIESILTKEIKKEEIKIEEIFKYGDKIVEFMLIYPPFIVSVSVVDDMSYDFTVFDSTGDTIVYNNTQFNVALDDLCDILLKDIDMIKNKRLYS